MSVESNAESLASALANLREEKRRWLAEEAKSKEDLDRKRERHDRERQLLARMMDELSKSRERFHAARTRAGASLEKMTVAVETKEGVEKKVQARETDMELLRVTRHGGEAVKAEEAEALMKEIQRKGKENSLEEASAAVKKIERYLRGGEASLARVAAELKNFEDAEKLTGKGDAHGSDMSMVDDVEDVGAALDAMDAFRSAVAALEKKRNTLRDATKNVDHLIQPEG